MSVLPSIVYLVNEVNKKRAQEEIRIILKVTFNDWLIFSRAI